MNYYWFSFCYEGKNTGVCIVMEYNRQNALNKIADLGILPNYDDIACYRIPEIESNMELDKLYSPEEMEKMNYKSVNFK